MIPRILAASALALALTAAPAAAQAPKPVPCTGMQAQDAVGDAFVGFVGLFETPQPAGANMDFKNLFFRRDKGKVTANLVVANLDKSVPPDAGFASWRVNYDIGDASYYVTASVENGKDPVFSYGHIDTQAMRDGDTKGAFFEGPDGVIQIEIPAAHAIKENAKVTEIYAFSAYVRGAAGRGVNTQTDQIPDGDARVSYTAAECPGAGSTPEPGTPNPGVTPPPPGSDPNTPAPPVQKPGSGSGAATGPLQIAVKPTALKAKKVKKSLKLTLTCSESLKDLAVQFKKGAKKIAAGKLATCSGKGKITLKISKKLKKGAYTLAFTGKRADTSSGTLTVKVKVS
jgi:hypothetical protein